MDLSRALDISVAGMAAQTTRLRVVAENLANRSHRAPGVELPAADRRGCVRTLTVNRFIEVMGMREAERSHDANLAVMQSTRGVLERTLEFLK